VAETAHDGIRVSFRIVLMPSSVPLAALTAARQMLLELKQTGLERNYFAQQKEFPETEHWYKDLGTDRSAT
jgi:hypothetical protein